MFPTLDTQDASTAFLLASGIAAIIALAATRGRLGYRPATRVAVAGDRNPRAFGRKGEIRPSGGTRA